jgi:hypothetical protein
MDSMQRFLLRLNLATRCLICRFFGHVKHDVSFRTVGLKQCLHCLRVTDHKTVRRRVTFGEVERRMAEHPPKGYSFVSCNWKKRKARFVSATGHLKFVTF